MEAKREAGRRDFMKAAIGAVTALISAVMVIPAILYTIGPSFRRETGEWIQLGPVSKVEVGTPTLFKARAERTAGWIRNTEELTAHVLTEEGREFFAMSNICTHLG